ncbi:hypothetical protein E2562_000063 [Oryza meyeriana var. granulata]|uniref:BAG domain-containing protein n=1 Tax=Oryza meyeriana var. granulata TaxID=110450 RepID=A0A6G1DC45_9ORYZ|nr:hypothetical protein E2562_000063 [Oryza meyeriana var. granulata]
MRRRPRSRRRFGGTWSGGTPRPFAPPMPRRRGWSGCSGGRARFSETLMAVLLRLDAVPGYYPAVREARHAMTHRVVGLQEVFDAVLAASEADACGVPVSLDQVLEGIWEGARETPAPPPRGEAKAAASGSASGDAERSRRREAIVESAEAGSGDGERSRMGL